MTAPEELLTLWRTAVPPDLLVDREPPAKLLAFLAARLDPKEGGEKQLLDLSARETDSDSRLRTDVALRRRHA